MLKAPLAPLSYRLGHAEEGSGHRRPPLQGQLPSCGFRRHNCSTAAQRRVASGPRGSRRCMLTRWAACGEPAGGGARDTTPRPSMPGAAAGTDGLCAPLLTGWDPPIVRATPFVRPPKPPLRFLLVNLAPLPRPPERFQSTRSLRFELGGARARWRARQQMLRARRAPAGGRDAF